MQFYHHLLLIIRWQLCPLKEQPAAETGSSNLSIWASHKHRAGTMRCWGNSCALHRCLKDVLPEDAHVKAPKSLLQITEHTRISQGDQAHFTHWKILCARTECIPLAFLEDGSFLVQHNHSYTSENRIIVTSGCSDLHAKQHELTQHIAYHGYCKTDQNAGCVFSVVSPSKSQLFSFFFSKLFRAKVSS